MEQFLKGEADALHQPPVQVRLADAAASGSLAKGELFAAKIPLDHGDRPWKHVTAGDTSFQGGHTGISESH